MKASKVKLGDYNTYTELDEIIMNIEDDYENTVGGFKAWNSGWDTKLTQTAKNKIEKLQAKMDKIEAHC